MQERQVEIPSSVMGNPRQSWKVQTQSRHSIECYNSPALKRRNYDNGTESWTKQLNKQACR
jgi:hypothetical protein